MLRRWLRRLALVLLALVALVLLVGLVGTASGIVALRASLPDLDGEHVVAGLAAPVVIERDALGIPTLEASDREDVAFAMGFLHAQDRYFQMDLLRRKGAGELAEWFGPPALGIDRDARRHRFRARALRALERSSPEERRLLERYTDGVNAGVESLGARPPEYWVPGIELRGWAPEDSFLVLYAMYLELQNGQWRVEYERESLEAALPAPLFRFLFPEGTSWDAPLAGATVVLPPLPGPEVLDLRTGEPAVAAGAGIERSTLGSDPVELPGSNNWAVAGTRTADGRALLANDMHLPLSLPNTWYRVSWKLPDRERVTGHTLPGSPFLVGGSNGRIAWGFTNSYIDSSDLVRVDPSEPVEAFEEVIRVRGGETDRLRVEETAWGPLLPDLADGTLALCWVAHEDGAANGGLLSLERASSVAEAIAAAPTIGIPSQNLVVADRDGSIGWTVVGRVPRRTGFDGSRSRSAPEAPGCWDGWLGPDEVPSRVDPAEGLVWTANNRVVGGAELSRLGGTGYDLGARAHQIRDDLRALDRPDEEALLSIQLDDRAVFLERWRDLLLEVLDDSTIAADPRRAELRAIVAEDDAGRASIDSVGYRVVRGFRIYVARQAFEPILAPFPRSRSGLPYLALTQQWEGPLWTLVRQRPPHLLDPKYDSWHAALVAAVDAMLDGLLEDEQARLSDRTWGERNTVTIRHPLSQAVPQLARWLDAPPRPLPGGGNMPRVQAPTFGASQRMVVSPGHEDQGVYHMPGGQSGHPLSWFYLAGHADWLQGTASPFLPGPPEHVLRLRPSPG